MSSKETVRVVACAPERNMGHLCVGHLLKNLEPKMRACSRSGGAKADLVRVRSEILNQFRYRFGRHAVMHDQQVWDRRDQRDWREVFVGIEAFGCGYERRRHMRP